MFKRLLALSFVFVSSTVALARNRSVYTSLAAGRNYPVSALR
jgi:hypothetical protein